MATDIGKNEVFAITKFHVLRPFKSISNLIQLYRLQFGFSTKKRPGKKATAEKHYSTWSDKYANIDRFFLWASPFLFLLFNVIYWFYFYVYDLLKVRFSNDNDPAAMQQQILINDDRDVT